MVWTSEEEQRVTKLETEVKERWGWVHDQLFNHIPTQISGLYKQIWGLYALIISGLIAIIAAVLNRGH